ncbi:TRAP transporter substrate-binding protein DctP [Spirochaetota bacterium]
MTGIQMTRKTMFYFYIIKSILLVQLLHGGMIKIATLAPEGSLWGACLDQIKKDVYFATEKNVRIKIYYGGKMGDENAMVDKIKIGYLGGGAFTGRGLGEISTEIRILEVPRLFRSSKEVDMVQKALYGDLDKVFGEKGFKIIGIIDTGFAYFFSKKDITSIKDIQKSKMWMWQGDPLVYQFMKSFEIKAKALNFIDVIPSLQTGMINGFYCSPMACISLQWFTEAKYMLDYKLASVCGAFVLSKKAWQRLSEEEQKTVFEISNKYLRELVEKNRQNDAESIELLKKYGITINKPSGDLAVYEEISREVKKSLEEKIYSKQISQKADDLLAKQRSSKKK